MEVQVLNAQNIEDEVRNALTRLEEGPNSNSYFRRDSDAVKVLEKNDLVEDNTELLEKVVLQTWPQYMPYGFELADVGCEALRALSENNSQKCNAVVRDIVNDDRTMHCAPVVKILDLMRERLVVAKTANREDTFAVEIVTSAAAHRMLQIREHVLLLAHDLVERSIESKIMKQLLVDGFSSPLPPKSEMPMRSSATAAIQYAKLKLPLKPLQSALQNTDSLLSENAKKLITEIILEIYG